MCGIAGIVSNNNNRKDITKTLDLMLRSISHRGPDDIGKFVEKNTAIGMTRLSIIDLNTGHQPIRNKDESIVMICNGEIYNHNHLKQLYCKDYDFKTTTDVEIIIPIYERFGLEGFSKLDGMFAFAILDRNYNKLHLCRDRYGIKPLYYFISDNGELIFSSEIKSILSANSGININIDVFIEYLIWGYSIGGESCWHSVKSLSPSSCLTFTVEEDRKVEYFIYNNDTKIEYYEDRITAITDLREAVINNVESQLMSDVPLGIFLSGGIDSSIIAGVISKILGKKHYPAFSINFNKSQESESEKFNQIARENGLIHSVFDVDNNLLELIDDVIFACDEPFGDPAALPTLLLCRNTVKDVKVALSGDGSDEYMFGYNYHAFNSNHNISISNDRIHDLLKKLPVITKYQYSLLYRTANSFPYPRSNIYEILRKKIFNSKYINPSVSKKYNTLTGFDRYSYLPNDILYKTDRMSMNCSLETRVPFLGNKTVSIAERIPREMQVTRSGQKRILIEAFEDILPDNIVKQKKHGFTVPLGEWICSIYQPEKLINVISDSILSDIINKQLLNIIIKQHFTKKFDHSRFLYRLMMGVRWLEINKSRVKYLA